MSLDIQALGALARDRGFPRATVCWTLGAPGDPMNETRLGLKLAGEALAAALAARGVPDDQAAAILDPFAAWARENTLSARGAVAAFLSPEGARIETVPRVGRDGAWVGEAYRLAPAWPDPASQIGAAALVADQGQARLLRLTPEGLVPMKADLPASMEDFMGPTEIEAQRDLAGKGQNIRHHGIGQSVEQEKEEVLEQYAGALAKGAAAALADSGLPLVIVADERLNGMIRARNHYSGLVAEGVTRHPSGISQEAMAEAVRDIAAVPWDRARETDLARLDEALGRGDPASDDPVEIAVGAAEGRVELLAFDPDSEIRGCLEGGVSLDADGPDDLLEAALRDSLSHKARVMAVRNPDRPLRALMRW
ncbi:MAG: hypothetical protein ACQEUZ_09785 [Pseudomonadota bacterium]